MIPRDPELRQRFAKQWLEAAWPLLTSFFRVLQQEGKISSEIDPDTLTRLFLSLNLVYLIGRHLLAPDANWRDEE